MNITKGHELKSASHYAECVVCLCTQSKWKSLL